VLSGVAADWPQDLNGLITALTDLQGMQGASRKPVHVFELPAFGDPRVSEGMDYQHLAWARRVELESFLRRTGAIWTPTSYHYQLPSGEHAASFVRLADTFNDPRAASALSSWLRGALTDTTFVIVDTGTIMPLVEQLDLLLGRAAQFVHVATPGLIGVEALDRYPRSRFQYLRQFKDAVAVDVLAILSVSSSGRTYRLLGQSLDETAGPERWRAECLVTREPSQQADGLPPTAEHGRQSAWLSLDELSASGREGACRLCGQGARARVIRIDPRTFGAMTLPSPVRIMPDLASARRNASLFDMYDADVNGVPAVQLSETETSAVRARPHLRTDQPERVRFEPAAILLQTDFESRLSARVRELHALEARDPMRTPLQTALQRLVDGEPTVAVCDYEEVEVLAAALREQGKDAHLPLDEDASWQAAEGRFLTAARAVCSKIERVVVIGTERVSSDGFCNDRSILFLVAGLQTGRTLQHLVVQAMSALSGDDAERADPQIQGLVLHAHPNTSEAWGHVQNTFGGRRDPAVVALWLTYLPSESPFVEEQALLAAAQDQWFVGARYGSERLLTERSSWLGSRSPSTTESPRPITPLWSTKPMALRRTSYYGNLNDRTVIPAMGAALTERLDRHGADTSPEWVQVDLPNALRSYFDGLLHVALLRWVSPARAWWGSENECASLIDQLHGRFHETDDWQLLLAELLLAVALGKLPDTGARQIMAHAQQALTEGDPSSHSESHPLGFIELGYMLVRGLYEAELDPSSSRSAGTTAVVGGAV
jgi:hypothetical protein